MASPPRLLHLIRLRERRRRDHGLPSIRIPIRHVAFENDATPLYLRVVKVKIVLVPKVVHFVIDFSETEPCTPSDFLSFVLAFACCVK